MEKYDETFSGTIDELKLIIGDHGIPFRSWADWEIRPYSYRDREVSIRITNQIPETFDELAEYFSSQLQLTPADNIRKASIFFSELYDAADRRYIELESDKKSLNDVVQKIGEMQLGDVLVVIDKYQPIKTDGSFGKKKLRITIADRGIRDPHLS